MKYLILSFLAAATLLAAQGKQTFTGAITDDECTRGDHSQMRMGSTDAACAIACVEVHGGQFVFFDGKDVLQLSDQDKSKEYAGRKVTVVGTLDPKTKTIHVDSIAAAK